MKVLPRDVVTYTNQRWKSGRVFGFRYTVRDVFELELFKISRLNCVEYSVMVIIGGSMSKFFAPSMRFFILVFPSPKRRYIT